MRKSAIIIGLLAISILIAGFNSVLALPDHNDKTGVQVDYGVVIKPTGSQNVEFLFKVVNKNGVIKSIGAFVKTGNKIEFNKVFIVNSDSAKLLVNPFSKHITIIKEDDVVTIPESFTVIIKSDNNNISVKVSGMGKVVSINKVDEKWPFKSDEKPPITPKPPVPEKPPMPQVTMKQNMYPAQSVFDYAYIIYIPIKGYSAEKLTSELPSSESPTSTVVLQVKKNMSITVKNVTVVSKNGVVNIGVDRKLPITLNYGDVLKVSFTITPKVNNFPLVFGMMMPVFKGKHVEGHPSFRGDDFYINPEYRQVIIKYLFLGNGCVVFINASVDGKDVVYFLPVGVRTVPLIPLFRFFTILR